MALSMDIRKKVIKAIAGGMSRRQAAARFDIGPATAVRWAKRVEILGSVAPSRMGGDRRSRRIEAHAEFILAQLEEQPDLTILELCEKIRERHGVGFGHATIWRFPGAAQNHAQEEDRSCVGAGKRGCCRGARSMVRGAARSRSLEARIPRRDGGFDQHGAPVRLGAARAALPDVRPVRMEDKDARRGAAVGSHRRADDDRRRDRRGVVPRLCRARR